MTTKDPLPSSDDESVDHFFKRSHQLKLKRKQMTLRSSPSSSTTGSSSSSQSSSSSSSSSVSVSVSNSESSTAVEILGDKALAKPPSQAQQRRSDLAADAASERLSGDGRAQTGLNFPAKDKNPEPSSSDRADRPFDGFDDKIPSSMPIPGPLRPADGGIGLNGIAKKKKLIDTRSRGQNQQIKTDQDLNSDVPSTIIVPSSAPNEINSPLRSEISSGQSEPKKALAPKKTNGSEPTDHDPTNLAALGAELPGQRSEIDPSCYVPPPIGSRPPPVVQYFSINNRPKYSRKTTAIQQLFPNPLHLLWQSKFHTFNHLQSEIGNILAHSDDTIVVSAPTGAGKTCVFEMAMAKHVGADLCASKHGVQQQLSNARKMVYISPSKALCEERFEDWTTRLSNLKLGIRIAMITGDGEPGDSYRDLASAHIVLTTPEKLDSLTRKWTEHFVLFGSIKLLMIDEIHLLGDQTRGSCLESVICRMKTIARATQNADLCHNAIRSSSFPNTTPEALASHVRIVAVSATLPNVSDIAEFLGANEAYCFDNSYRPVPLTTHCVGLWKGKNNDFMFNKGLIRHVPDIIERYSSGKPSIVFCHTKKETEELSLFLGNHFGSRFRGASMQLAGRTKITSLQKCLSSGMAYHHAGLEPADRKLIEKGFCEGKIRVLCATSTLAMGVNLPARLVVIKGTSTWRGGAGHQEIDKGSLLQMIGRAGRPGCDTSGVAVILTDNESKSQFQNLSRGLDTIESQLQSKLVEAVNTEVSQRVITSFDTAVRWLATSFLYVRLRSNPSAYGIPLSSDFDLRATIVRNVGEALNVLDANGIVTVSKDGSRAIEGTVGGEIMSGYLVNDKAMQTIVALRFDASPQDILSAISSIEGLHRPVRRSEKKELNEVHKDVRYKWEGLAPSKVRIQTPQQKAFVLLQSAIGQKVFQDFTLRNEMSVMMEYANRMLAATEEYSSWGSRNGYVALQSLLLRRSLCASLWGSRDGVINQIPGVGAATTAKLKFNRINSFQDVLDNSVEHIEKAAGRSSPFGQQLKEIVQKITEQTLHMTARIDGSSIVVELHRANAPREKSHNNDNLVTYSLVIFTDRPGGSLLNQANISKAGEYIVRTPKQFGRVYVHLVSSYIGLDEVLELEGPDQVVKSSFSLITMKIGRGTRVSNKKHQPSRMKKVRNTAPKSAFFGAFSKNHESAPQLSPAAISPSPTQNSSPNAKCMNAATLTDQRQDPSKLARLRQRREQQQQQQQQEDSVMPTNAVDSSLEGIDFRPKRPSFSSEQGIISGVSPVREPRPRSIHPYSKEDGWPSTDQNQDVTTPTPERKSPPGAPRAKRRFFETDLSRPPSAGSEARKRKRSLKQNTNAWNKTKKEQRAFQAVAFRSKKENPFANYKYDPNNVESNLDFLASQPSDSQGNGEIIPPGAFAKYPKARWIPKSKSLQRPVRLRGNRSSSGVRKRPKRSSPPFVEREVIHMKVDEHRRHPLNPNMHYRDKEYSTLSQPTLVQQSCRQPNPHSLNPDSHSPYPCTHPYQCTRLSHYDGPFVSNGGSAGWMEHRISPREYTPGGEIEGSLQYRSRWNHADGVVLQDHRDSDMVTHSLNYENKNDHEDFTMGDDSESFSNQMDIGGFGESYPLPSHHDGTPISFVKSPKNRFDHDFDDTFL